MELVSDGEREIARYLAAYIRKELGSERAAKELNVSTLLLRQWAKGNVMPSQEALLTLRERYEVLRYAVGY